MLNDMFRVRYGKVPLAVYCQKGAGDTWLHNHAEFEIVRITAGTCIFFINGTSYRGQTGDMFFINPLEVHSIQVDDTGEFAHQCICFEDTLIKESEIRERLSREELHIVHHISVNHPAAGFVWEAFERVLEVYGENGSYMETEISSWLSLMFIHLVKHNLIDRAVRRNRDMLFCAKVIHYIAVNYGEKITSREAAAELSYNQSYFCRNFRQSFGMSFTEYLNQYRIGVSRVLLEAKEKNITEIAMACGFNTPAHFSGCFKKYVGILPSQYYESGRKVNADQ